MSVQLKGYVGPYIRTTWGEKEWLVDRFCCVNANCERHQVESNLMTETFCSKCGHKLDTIKVLVAGKDMPVPGTFFKGLRLLHNNEETREHIWISDYAGWEKPAVKNFFKTGSEPQWSREFDFTGEDGRTVFPIYQTTASQACTCFAGVFRNEIEEMKAVYDRVELLFGLVTWVS